jgi:glycosyltransferase involved in cell wall biosynthesis
MFLSIVIPAYNEEKRISETLEKYLCFYNHNDSAEFIIVLNGCQDNTLGIVSSFKKKYPAKIQIIEIKEAGKGRAVRKGFQMANGELIGFVDADGATDPDEFGKLVKNINGFDGAIASRWKRGSEVINRNFFRKIVSLCFVLLVRLIVWLPFLDTQCGAKVFKKEVIDTILQKLKVNDMAFDVEVLYQCKIFNFKIKEVPSRWVDKDSSGFLGSPFKVLSSGIRMLITLINIRLRK